MTLETKYNIGDVVYYLPKTEKGFRVSRVEEITAIAKKSFELEIEERPNLINVYILEDGTEVTESQAYETKDELTTAALAGLDIIEKHLRLRISHGQ